MSDSNSLSFLWLSSRSGFVLVTLMMISGFGRVLVNSNPEYPESSMVLEKKECNSALKIPSEICFLLHENIYLCYWEEDYRFLKGDLDGLPNLVIKYRLLRGCLLLRENGRCIKFFEFLQGNKRTCCCSYKYLTIKKIESVK
jgi:hypothetical protein